VYMMVITEMTIRAATSEAVRTVFIEAHLQ